MISVKIILEKAMNDKKMMIAECVPDNESKTIYIKSAYKVSAKKKTAKVKYST